MERQEFKERYLVNTKIKITCRSECYEFQRIAFKFGVRVFSQPNNKAQEPIAYNIADIYPKYKGKIFATNMTNLVIYKNGLLQKSAFYHLETGREISFTEMIADYKALNKPINLTDPITQSKIEQEAKYV
jgi:hypothetical protein